MGLRVAVWMAACVWSMLTVGGRAMFTTGSGNPFEGKTFYVNPAYQKELDSSIATATGTVKSTLQSMRDVPSAYWLDVKAKIHGDTTDTMEGILKDAASKSPAQLVVFIVYDLPNRDCAAHASNGEICCNANADGTCDYDKGGDCSSGITEYKTEYIDPLVAVLKEYHTKVPIVLVIEPDSLPNLATNMGNPHCGNSATQAAYKECVPYAVNSIAAAAPNVVMYLDAAHGGWLGWENNIAKFATLIKGMDIMGKLRGFTTNVANYQPLGVACPAFDWCLQNKHPSDPCCADPCKLEGQYNPANNEHNYVMELARYFNSSSPPHFVTDTGRNGVANMRQQCSNWCNIRGAGVGLVSSTKTSTPLLDAYYWLKTPGESDGCTQTLPNATNPFKPGGKCARYDSMCGSSDSIGSKAGEPYAPEAGRWFDYQIKMLAQNAHMHPSP